MKILENIGLKNYTTFRLGGPARFFIEVTSEKDLAEALGFARQKALPFLILGRGSNLIFPDEGYNGVIIYPRFLDLRKISDYAFYTGASVLLDDLIDWMTEKNMSGLEWAAGIPGTLGGAVFGNAGANSGETKDNILKVRIMTNEGKIEEIDNKDCQFGYRSSVFKEKKWVILGAELKFKIQNSRRPEASGPEAKFKIKETVQKYRTIRKEKHPLEYPSAGSIFKNVPVKEIPEEYREKFKDSVKTDPFPVVPAAKIIAEAGLAGAREGDAQVSEKHTNFIINLGSAKTVDVLELIKKVKSVVKEKFGVELSVEPIIV